jgi:DNA-binding response OmpR family regulator
VEDEEGIRKAMAEFLQMSGFVVTMAENGRLAIDIYEQQPERYGLIILDLSLPVLHGRYVLEHIRQTNTSLPVILLSGYTQDIALEGISNLTNCIFIKKPFNMYQLIEKSRELLKM